MRFMHLIYVMAFILVVFAGLNEIGQEVQFNTNLDNDSQQLIVDIKGEVDGNWNSNILAEDSSSLNTSTEGQDPFAKEYLDRQSSSNKKTSMVQNIKNIPDTIILSIGFDNADFDAYITVIAAVIGIIILVVIFAMFFGGDKLDN